MWLILFGVAVGLLSGTLGIGGGVVVVPGLILLFGFTQLEAQGTSLAVLSLPICLAAAAVYYQNGHVRPAVVGLIALGFVVGAVVGAKLIAFAPEAALRFVFGGLLVYLGLTFVFATKSPHGAAALPAAIGSLFTVLAGLFWRRRRATVATLPPPNADFEYHI
jgi:uncharacterized membrane protein YfcA